MELLSPKLWMTLGNVKGGRGIKGQEWTEVISRLGVCVNVRWRPEGQPCLFPLYGEMRWPGKCLGMVWGQNQMHLIVWEWGFLVLLLT